MSYINHGGYRREKEGGKSENGGSFGDYVSYYDEFDTFSESADLQ